MKKLKGLWKENKKKILLFGSIGILVLIIIIICSIILINVFKKYDYVKIENMMVSATSKYLKNHSEITPKIEGEIVTVEIDSLVQEKYIKELAKLSKDNTCTGNVFVISNANQLRYVPSLECINYKTTSLNETILKRENVVSENAGMYDMNGYYTYRGEYVNNYVNFANYSWRILKFNEEIIYLILSDTLNSKTSYVFDDRFNESINSYRGKNDFATSRVNLSLQGFYNEYFAKYHYLLKNTDACVQPRSEMDTDKSGMIECYTTISTPISLLAVYDYMNASIDNQCITSTSKNCTNYNYLSKTKNKYWLLNGTNENSHEVYFAGNNGSLSLESASTKKDLRIVITLPSDIIYKDGIGTSTDPYTIYEY